MSKKEVAAQAEAQMPSYIQQGSNRGNESVTNDDIQLPRIDVLQALSPQINKKKDSYIEGAEVGMFFNTLTGELYPDGVSFTPVTFEKRFLVWVDREQDNNGGLRGVFDTEIEAEQFVSAAADGNKLEIVPTAEHLVILDNGDQAIISMAKSKMKISRKFNSLVRMQGGDRFARRYSMTSFDDEGPKGEFQNLKIELAKDGQFPSEEVYKLALKTYEAIASGNQKMATGNYSEGQTFNGDEKAEF